MHTRSLLCLFFWFSALISPLFAADPQQSEAEPWGGCIQTLPLEAEHPYFLPANPKVTLTIRFPDLILDVDGAGFTTNEAQMPGDYRISWREGDDYLSITQIGKAAVMRNLNVIVSGQTIVLVLYPVENPLQTVTSLTFVPKTQFTKGQAAANNGRKVAFRARPAGNTESSATANNSNNSAPEAPPRPTQSFQVEKRDTLPDAPFERSGPARLIGMIDRLKLLHATRPDQMDAVLASMSSVSVADFGKSFDQGMLHLQLVRVARDSRLDLVGFIVLVRNVTKSEVVIDPESWAARLGLGYFPQAISDSAPKIPPGETSVAYFVIAGDSDGHPGYLKADNDWRVSVAIVSPKLNPGAMLSEEFAKEIH